MTSPLNAELHQAAPFHSLEEETYLSVLRTAESIRREVSILLKPYELTGSQYNVLRILRGAGADGQLTGEIGERLVVRDPDVPRLLDRMEKRGLVHRQRQSDDRRCVRVTLTKAGRTLVDSLDKPIQALHVTQFRGTSKAALRALLDTLSSTRARAAKREPAD
jgi:DNA-binding MarR family transcriptional regulator